MINMGDFKKNEKNEIIFQGKYMEMYIPQFYFDKNVAQSIGDHFKTLGILNFRTFTDIDGKGPSKLRTFTISTIIYTYPSGGYTEETLDLVGKGKEKYYVLKFYNGDKLCDSEQIASLDNFRAFLDILLGGKLPGTIPYDVVIDLFNNNFALNGIDFPVPDNVKEIIISKIYRYKKDPSVAFGVVYGKNPNISPYDYITMNPRAITRMDSTYAGLTFEDFDGSVISGLLTTKQKRKEVASPMEPVMKA
jgi:hypothetical protein